MAEQLIAPEFGQHGSLRRLTWDGQQWILPWGLEMADALSFFSLETGGWDSDAVVISQETSRARTAKPAAAGYAGRAVAARLGGSRHRHGRPACCLLYAALANGWAMDFVMRFAFRRQAITHAQIAADTILWDGANYYHQYPGPKRHPVSRAGADQS